MPKEIIRTSNEHSPIVVQVSWHPSGVVQVASLNPTIERQPGSSEAGWYSTLDRTALNRLIRTLRRARDAAYGADA